MNKAQIKAKKKRKQERIKDKNMVSTFLELDNIKPIINFNARMKLKLNSKYGK